MQFRNDTHHDVRKGLVHIPGDLFSLALHMVSPDRAPDGAVAD